MNIEHKKHMSVFKSHMGAQKFVARKWLVDHFHRQDDERIYYRPCLICGQDNHGLIEHRGIGVTVVSCPLTMKFLIIQEVDILSVIEKEENEFRGLLDKWQGKIPDKLTPEEAFRLRTQDGVPMSILESRVENSEALYLLFEEHRKKSGNTFRKEIF